MLQIQGEQGRREEGLHTATLTKNSPIAPFRSTSIATALSSDRPSPPRNQGVSSASRSTGTPVLFPFGVRNFFWKKGGKREEKKKEEGEEAVQNGEIA